MALKKAHANLNLLQGIRMVFAANAPLQLRLHWILRISSGLCFIGHGAWGVITKAGWLPFYNVWNVPHTLAWLSMPLVGIIDIVLGVMLLMKPVRFIMIYMAIWAVFTALLRPLAGLGWWEFLERGGNYGAPLALLFLSGVTFNLKDWFDAAKEPLLTKARSATLSWHLRVYTALLMIGHGGYGAFQQKDMLIGHFKAVGVPPSFVNPHLFITCFGLVEIMLGILIFWKPTRFLAMFIVVWKLSTEFLYIVHGPLFWEMFEFIERWGSYGCPLALYYLLGTEDWKGKADMTSKEKFNWIIIAMLLFIVAIVFVPKNIMFKKQNTVSQEKITQKAAKTKERLPGEIDVPDFSIEQLKQGGYVVFFRHTKRDLSDNKEQEKLRNVYDRDSVCAKNTQLNKDGIAHAKKIGEVFRALNIPKDEVIITPSCRNQQMRKLMFGNDNYMTMNELLYIYARDPKVNHAEYNQVITEVLTEPLYHGKNRIVLSHKNVIRHDTIGFAIALEEGDAAIFQPTGVIGKFNPVGRIKIQDWLEYKIPKEK